MKSKFRKRRALSVSLSSLAVLSLCLSVSLSWAASARRVSLSRVAVLLYDASLLFVRASTAVIGDATLPPRVGPRRGSSTCSTPSKLSDGSTLPLAPHADYTHTHTHTHSRVLNTVKRPLCRRVSIIESCLILLLLRPSFVIRQTSRALSSVPISMSIMPRSTTRDRSPARYGRTTPSGFCL